MKPKVSSFVKAQLPDFVGQQSTTLQHFLETYYQFLEKEVSAGVHSPIGFLRAAIEQKDIDTASEVFRQYIKKQVLPSLPRNETQKIDDQTLIKHIQEYIKVKGTAGSYQFAMQALFDNNASTTQMADYVFRTSDNNYVEKTIIVVKNVDGNTYDLTDLLGSTLYQQEPVAAAFVDRVSAVSYNGTTYYTCTLRQDTIFGTFLPGVRITGKFRETGTSVTVEVDHILGKVNVTSPGSLYNTNQDLKIAGGSGVNGEIYIDEISSGGVDGYIVTRYGEDHKVGDSIFFESMNGYGSGAAAEVSAIDGINAVLLPVMEVDTVSVADGGLKYNVGDRIQLNLPGTNTKPILQVTSVSTAAANVDVNYGGSGYTYARAMFASGGSYYTTTPTVVNGSITSVPMPGTSLTTATTLYINGSGGTGTLTITGNTITGHSITAQGYNYIKPRLKLYSDVGMTTELANFGDYQVSFTLNATTKGVTALTIVRGGYFPSNGTVYFKIIEETGSGCDADVFMGGTITGVSVIDRGEMRSDLGGISAYNVGSVIYGSTITNTSAKFNVEYRVKKIYISNAGWNYRQSFNLAGFDIVSTSNVLTNLTTNFVATGVVKVGSLVQGTGIPADTYVTEIVSATSIKISNNATASNNNVTLTFGGTYSTISGGKGSGAILNPLVVDDAITSITITNGGTLYPAYPGTVLTVLSGTGTGAVLKPIISGGVITSVEIVDCGSGYVVTDPIVISSTAGSGGILSINAVGGITDGVVRRVDVRNGGNNYQTNATLSFTGIGSSAAATATIEGGVITAVTVTNRGSGYDSTTSVSVVEGGTDSTISTSTSANGVIEKVTIANKGYGYYDPTEVTPLVITVADPTSPSLTLGGSGYAAGSTFVSVTGDGSGATAVANVVSGKVVSVTVTSKGSGYTYANIAITGAGTGAHAVARLVNGQVYTIDMIVGKVAKLIPTLNSSGAIESVEIVDPGFGYISSPSITITGGSGVGASLTSATWDATDRTLTGFTLASGSGYKYGTRIVVDGEGSGAVLTPTVETGITKLEIENIGRTYTSPKVLIYEDDNASAKVNLALGSIKRTVRKFIGNTGSGTFNVGDSIYVGTNYASATKKGVVVKVEGTGTNPIIHYYLQDQFPIHFSSADTVKTSNDDASCVAGTGSGADLEAYFVNGTITSINIVSAGTGYSQNSTIEFANMDGVGARGSVTVNIAAPYEITSAIVLDGGSGYYNWLADPTVIIHSNTNLESDVVVYDINGTIESFDIDDKGSGYINPICVVYNNPGDAQVSGNIVGGAITSYTVTKNGVYTSGVAPSVVIIGDGTGATATASLDANNRIASVSPSVNGSGYTWAHVYLTDNVGVDGKVKAYAERFIKDITISNGGTNYHNAFLSVIGDGSDAFLTATVSGFGAVLTATVTAAGSRYTTYPTITVTDTSAFGSISKVKILNKGSGYTALPKAIIENNVNNAQVIPTSTSIGAVKGFRTTDFGFGYNEVPMITFPLNAIITETHMPFKEGELVYVQGFNYPDNDYTKGPHAYVMYHDLVNNFIELSDSTDKFNLVLTTAQTGYNLLTENNLSLVHEFSEYIGTGSVIVGATSGLQAKVRWQNRATGYVENTSVGSYKAQFDNASGYLSNENIRLHDSYKYQDYAYKVTTGLSLKDYENVLKTLVHPSGFKMFGDIEVESYAEVGVKLPTTDTGVASEELKYLLLFSLYADLSIGDYYYHLTDSNVIQSLIFMKVGELSAYTIQQIMDNEIDLSPYKDQVKRAMVFTEVTITP